MADNDKDVRVELTQDNAVLLLAAAQELELDPGVVRTTSDNVLIVPSRVARKAGVDEVAPTEYEVAVQDALDAADAERADREAEVDKQTKGQVREAKKATAKKATARKSAGGQE